MLSRLLTTVAKMYKHWSNRNFCVFADVLELQTFASCVQILILNTEQKIPALDYTLELTKFLRNILNQFLSLQVMSEALKKTHDLNGGSCTPANLFQLICFSVVPLASCILRIDLLMNSPLFVQKEKCQFWSASFLYDPSATLMSSF